MASHFKCPNFCRKKMMSHLSIYGILMQASKLRSRKLLIISKQQTSWEDQRKTFATASQNCSNSPWNKLEKWPFKKAGFRFQFLCRTRDFLFICCHMNFNFATQKIAPGNDMAMSSQMMIIKTCLLSKIWPYIFLFQLRLTFTKKSSSRNYHLLWKFFFSLLLFISFVLIQRRTIHSKWRKRGRAAERQGPAILTSSCAWSTMAISICRANRY